MAYYSVTVAAYDGHSQEIVEGPEVEDWEKYCKSLENEVYEMALEQEKERMCRITTETLFDTLIMLLKTKGYSVVKFEDKCFEDGQSKFPFKIKEHNLISSIENEKKWVERAEEKDKYMFQERVNELEEELKKLREEINE